MDSPNEPLRKAYIQAIATALAGIPVWAKKIPKNVTPVPSLYILIISQEKQRTAIGKDCWEWLCQITLDITYVNPQGYSDTVKIDDVEAAVITAVEAGINVEGFMVKSVDLVNSSDLDTETPTQSIERRILIYEHWLCQE